MSLEANLALIKERIKRSCIKSNRNQNDVKIIAVTKYVDVDQTKEVLDLGLEHLGENRVQNALPKYEKLQGRGFWHFIGRLQSKKVKQILGKFDYIHSLDRLSLAEEIDKRAKQLGIKVKCFVQVNISKEETKTGVEPENLLDFIKEVSKFDSIQLVGLMTMAPYVEDKELTRPIFRKLRELLEQINDQNILDYKLTELSMGMSNDFEVAIEEGATFIRIGSLLLK
ncbi:YggS family pyridoxal phosphate enzyme [Vulcanibacillus modesticaldus]|uniref:Pyridoxal phosphate homeostasis protein n=1 Tax=Vulcanibacillus modesticaldus TaxID=337097 RepID=A0A1D2YV25_9BACI|nr:YggS family pyridoxal phosphate-dependent enzyme [Vulcanibacillus modesticaldus]OEF99537.1 YggS family pyridoxal phosphate enzyme [Vulcanibacillus modesticaldus]